MKDRSETAFPYAAPVSFSIDDARLYIAQARWQFAKTMPRWPHDYTVRSWNDDLEVHFASFVELIRSEGTVKPWPTNTDNPRYHHTYLLIDGWDYWTMGASVDETEVINRAAVANEGRVMLS